MSTRAHIRIQDKDNVLYLYHHFDGYPEGVGEELKETLKTFETETWTAEYIHRSISCADDSYEDAPEGQHGDEEYAYLIDCGTRTLKCYKVGWDEDYPWKEHRVVFEEKFPELTGGVTGENTVCGTADWTSIQDSLIAATKEELAAFWKVASMKNAVALGLKPEITSADPRVDRKTLLDIKGMLSRKEEWFHLFGEAGFVTRPTSNTNELCFAKGDALVNITGVYLSFSGVYTISGSASVQYAGESAWHAKMKEAYGNWSWINGVCFEAVSVLAGRTYTDEDGNAGIPVDDGNLRLLITNKDGLCELSKTITVTDDEGDELFRYNLDDANGLI